MKPVVRLVVISLLSALLLVVQVALALVPNVELVSLLILIYTLLLPLPTALGIVSIFVTLEFIVWGFGDWVIGYYWIWPLWVLLVYLTKWINKDDPHRWALLGALWGILFGILFSLHHGILYGMTYSYAYWIRGISFDIIHAISNYILILLSYRVIFNILKKLLERLGVTYESNHKNR